MVSRLKIDYLLIWLAYNYTFMYQNCKHTRYVWFEEGDEIVIQEHASDIIVDWEIEGPIVTTKRWAATAENKVSAFEVEYLHYLDLKPH